MAADGTLNINYWAAFRAVSYFLGLGHKNPSESTSDNLTLVTNIVRSGYRQFLYPPAIGGISHKWRFMQPTAGLTAWADIARDSSRLVSTGTGDEGYNVANNDTHIIGSTGFFSRFMPGHVINVDVAGVATDFTIKEFFFTSNISVVGDASGVVQSQYSIASDGNYNLPDTFGGIDGPLTFNPTTHWPDIEVTSQQRVLANRKRNTNRSRPTLAAVRPKPLDDQEGQRFEIMLYPEPDVDYQLTYRFTAIPQNLDTLTNVDFLGGMKHSETILASCLAVAERRGNDEKGIKWDEFIERLTASISMDRAEGPESLGYNGDNSDQRSVGFDPRFRRDGHFVTQNGILAN